MTPRVARLPELPDEEQPQWMEDLARAQFSTAEALQRDLDRLDDLLARTESFGWQEEAVMARALAARLRSRRDESTEEGRRLQVAHR